MLKRAGYQTALIGKWGLGGNDSYGIPNRQGFDYLKRENFAQDSLTANALKYVEANQKKPFFVYLSYAAPHVSLQAQESEIEKNNFPEYITQVLTVENYIPAFKPRATRAAMVSYLDNHVGKLLDKLRDLNIDKNTLDIFTSDNGPSFGGGADLAFFEANGPLRGYKRDLYEGRFACQ